jgi:hypothetical protein
MVERHEVPLCIPRRENWFRVLEFAAEGNQLSIQFLRLRGARFTSDEQQCGAGDKAAPGDVTAAHASALLGGLAGMMRANADAIRSALESAGIQFIPENGGGVGVRLREPGK